MWTGRTHPPPPLFPWELPVCVCSSAQRASEEWAGGSPPSPIVHHDRSRIQDSKNSIESRKKKGTRSALGGHATLHIHSFISFRSLTYLLSSQLHKSTQLCSSSPRSPFTLVPFTRSSQLGARSGRRLGSTQPNSIINHLSLTLSHSHSH